MRKQKHIGTGVNGEELNQRKISRETPMIERDEKEQNGRGQG